MFIIKRFLLKGFLLLTYPVIADLRKRQFYVWPETNCQGLFHQIHKKSTKKGARSTVWLLTPRLIDYIFPFSRSLQRYA